MAEKTVPDRQDHYAAVLALTDLTTPHAVRAAVGLHLPRLVEAGACSVETLAARSGAHPRAVKSLVGYLTAKGVFAEPQPGVVALTPVGRLLAADRATAMLDPGEAGGHLSQVWSGLPHAVRTGSAAYPAVFGRPLWDALGRDPALAASFDRYMASWAEQWIPDVVRARDWSAVRRVVDVGGGIGRLLCALLAANPGLQGTLVELPRVAERGRDALATAGLAERGRVVEGSLFAPMPPGSDIYILAQVLHDWPDREAVRILQRCTDAARPGGKVLLIERLVATSPSLAHLRSDLFMLSLFGGAERSLVEFTALADSAGLEIRATGDIGHDLSFIECAPKEPNSQ
jgi:SAM-dependent methyltransferase